MSDTALEAPKQRKRIRELEVMVADTIEETPDTTTLVLFTGNDRLEYQAGHFLTIDPHQFPQLQRFIAYLEDVKGKKELPRAYSMCSAPHEQYLAVTVKEEQYVSGVTKYPPLLSPLLVRRLPRGTRLQITGFTGPYVLPPDIETRTDHIIHVCAGSGIVPNYSIIRHCLEVLPRLKHTLIYTNRTLQDIIFRRQLEELEAQYPEKMRVVHTLTRDVKATIKFPQMRQGRINEGIMREFIPAPSEVQLFCCGPGITKYDREAAKIRGETAAPRFLETTLSLLETIGVKNNQIHRESYG